MKNPRAWVAGALLSLVASLAGAYYLSGQDFRVELDHSAAVNLVLPSVVQVRITDWQQLVVYSGTGFAVDNKGTIVTCFHVIDRLGNIDVVFADGNLFSARVVTVDEQYDIAVLSIGAPTSAAALGDVGKLRVGQSVAFIGRFDDTEDRVTAASLVSNSWLDERRLLIAVDREAREGNSGGPLLNMHGEIVGVLTKSGVGISIAIPINRVTRLLGF